MTEQPGGASIGAPDVGLYLDDDQSVAAVSHPIAPGPSLHLASLHSTVLNTQIGRASCRERVYVLV